MCPLLGLAPGGVCHASPVTSAAVGSYPTLSPLPSGRSPWAVYFLWHFPSAHAGRLLAVALSTWSPDFPPVWGYPHTSGCPAIWSGGGYRGFGGGVQMGERNENERCAALTSHCCAMGPSSPGGRGAGASPQAQRKTPLPRSGRGGALSLRSLSRRERGWGFTSSASQNPSPAKWEVRALVPKRKKARTPCGLRAFPCVSNRSTETLC